jgi:hypothetical protein
MSQEYDVMQSKYGPISIIATGEGHIFADAKEGLTIRGVVYHATAHFYLHENGEFYLGEPGKNSYEQSLALYMRRRDRYSNDYPSQPAIKTAREVFTENVQAWANANPKKLLAASIEHYETKAEHLTEELEELNIKMAKMQVERAALLDKAAKLQRGKQ